MAFIRQLGVSRSIGLILLTAALISIAVYGWAQQEVLPSVISAIGLGVTIVLVEQKHGKWSSRIYYSSPSGTTLRMASMTTYGHDARQGYKDLDFQVENYGDSRQYYMVTLTRGCEVREIGEEMSIRRNGVDILSHHRRQYPLEEPTFRVEFEYPKIAYYITD